jgi:hypothetical protein
MMNYKEFFMALRTIGILYLFYLQFTYSVNIPMSVILLLTVGSLGLAFFCKSKNNSQVVNHNLYNYAISLGGIFLILKQYA